MRGRHGGATIRAANASRQLALAAGATCPDRVALIADGIELGYAELEREATATARRLAARGARRGATVAIELAPGIEHVVLLHALMKLGAVAHPLNTRLPEARAGS